MSAAQEKFLLSTNLSGLLNACVGEIITVELRNEAYVTGKLVSSDGFMCCSLEKAQLIDPAGARTKFDSFFVHSRLIRYVQLPETMDISTSLERQIASQVPGRGLGRGRGRGLSRRRQQIMDNRDVRRQQDLRNAHKMREEMLKEKEIKKEKEMKKEK